VNIITKLIAEDILCLSKSVKDLCAQFLNTVVDALQNGGKSEAVALLTLGLAFGGCMHL
jgi:hypothetical protein